MAQEKTTIARPYAEAIFARAQETGQLEQWSEMLQLLAAVSADPEIQALLGSPKVDLTTMQDLLAGIAGERLTDEGRNLVKLLLENGRLKVVVEITQLFEELRSQAAGTLDVRVVSAYPLETDQQTLLATALKQRLGREIAITTEADPTLLAGVRIYAGDLVIDGSLKSRLQQLATELSI